MSKSVKSNLPSIQDERGSFVATNSRNTNFKRDRRIFNSSGNEIENSVVYLFG
jgi:hypothetical protein